VETQLPEALLELIDNPSATDICLASGLTQVDSGWGLITAEKLALTEAELSALAKDLIELGGRRLDQANPFADVSLPASPFQTVADPTFSANPNPTCTQLVSRGRPYFQTQKTFHESNFRHG